MIFTCFMIDVPSGKERSSGRLRKKAKDVEPVLRTESAPAVPAAPVAVKPMDVEPDSDDDDDDDNGTVTIE